MAKKLLYELSQLEKLLLESPVFPSRIAALRIAFPDTPDSTLRGLLKRQDVKDAFTVTSKITPLIIGDLHAPFTLDRYLQHCQHVYRSEGCNAVIGIGDVVTNHRSSYHESEVDAMSAEEELELAIEHLKPWGEAFPSVDVVMGNHDAIIARKAKSGGLSSRWFRSFSDVLGLTGWRFHEEFTLDGVLYRHNVGSSPLAAANMALKAGQSVVGGHVHTKAGVVHVGNVFGALTGVGVDKSAYDQRYATSPEPYQVACAVVYGGKRAAIFPMDRSVDI